MTETPIPEDPNAGTRQRLEDLCNEVIAELGLRLEVARVSQPQPKDYWSISLSKGDDVKWLYESLSDDEIKAKIRNQLENRPTH